MGIPAMVPRSSTRTQEADRGTAPVLGGRRGKSLAGVAAIHAQPSRMPRAG
jgi:hypothetical protein